MATQVVFEKDCFVNSALPDQAYGGVTTVEGYDNTDGKVANQFWILAEVDFSAECSDLTDEDQVTAAVCKMYQDYANNSLTARWARNTADFTEDVVTWNTKPSTSTPNSDAVVCASVGWKTWDILDQIKDAVTSRSRVWTATLQVTAYTPNVNNEAEFYSGEYTTDTSLRPYIEIDYTAGGVTFTAKVMMF